MQIPGYSQLVRTYKELSPLELVIFIVLAITLIASTIMLAGNLQSELSESTPTRGGTYTEGIVGFPQYINPVLARTDADKDAAALVYAGLTKLTANGEIELDLAEQLEISPDGETYTFTLREDAYFHDGHPVHAEDVIYTIGMIQDQRINSPLQADWSGVLVRAIDERTVAFDLPQAFQSFPYNTRLGILPKHLWDEETTASFPFSSLNTVPIGAGPYEVSNVDRSDEGIPARYTLTAVDTGPEAPHIHRIMLQFYQNYSKLQEDFRDGNIDATYGINPEDITTLPTKNTQILERPLNRIFAVYFNQNNNDQLVDVEVRQALSLAISKKDIIDEVLHGYGSEISGPLPIAETTSATSSLNEAESLLESAGWVLEDGQRVNNDGEVLSIALTTATVDALEQTASIITDRWEALGISVEVTSLSAGNLLRDVIRPREYEALLFGQSINQSQDLYPFWHSGEQDDPGLNLAMYANTSVDESLSSWRAATSSSERAEIQQSTLESIVVDQPAIFLYAPSFIYLLPERIQNPDIPQITSPADRFAQIEDWYIRTDKLWSVFSADEPSEEQEVATSSEGAATSTATETEQ